MSNPFADPSHSQGMDSNPFADPAIQSAQHSTHQEASYGHYASNDDTPTASKLSLPDSIAPPAQGQGDMSSRFNDLAKREQALAAREAQLSAKAEHIRKHGRNNWPPGPWPLIFHDIDQEIPEQHKSTVLTLYRLWMFLIIVLLVNFVADVLLLVSGASNGGADLGSGIMYVPVIGILSFLTWYRPAYNAYMKEASVFYYIYFIFAGFHLAFSAYMIVGIPSSGSAGLINLISSFGRGSILAGVFCTIATAGWVMQGLASLWMYKQVWAHSHGEAGHTFSSAKEEISMYGIKAFLFKGSTVPIQTGGQA
ncbi:scamp family-domain-containing protein [Leucosporidium creatinivorum]|uniref:Scamp family-domain-containing protein n=1 Tax=Leucosporidium creatinivorum TaxID=106004 RepID=A0A1Y2EP24_9BASI|nr:scamp family-domain-containing protein [Leucosporidium creatinivorum]